MPLPQPATGRHLSHVRRVTYQGFERDDGLWDIEAELHDSKAFDLPSRHATSEDGMRRAGEAIHHMWLRVTVDTSLTVLAIDSAMDAHPLGQCPESQRTLQRMVGVNMARGWRKAINQHLGGTAGCTHMRELLFNLATATFQTVHAAFTPASSDIPPRHLDQCHGWALDGAGVKEHYPQFYRRRTGEEALEPVALDEAATR